MNQSHSSTRRDALKNLATTGAATGALMLAAKIGRAQDAPTAAPDATAAAPKMALASGDLDIVRFALTLERLEAAFYSQVVAAHEARAYLPERSIVLAREIAAAEAEHVQALEGVLTSAGAPVPPAQTFQFSSDFFVSSTAYAWFAYTLEEIGIGAYLGAVGKIQNDDLRRSAAAIYGAEARHAAILRTQAGFEFAPLYYESPLTVEQVTRLIAPYIVA